MSILETLCLVLGIIFYIVALAFSLLKEKGAILVAGFNYFSKEKRKEYDQKRIVLDMRNDFFIWGSIMILGCVLSHFISFYCGIIAIIIWVVLFFKDVNLDPEKAFEKYKK